MGGGIVITAVAITAVAVRNCQRVTVFATVIDEGCKVNDKIYIYILQRVMDVDAEQTCCLIIVTRRVK